MDNSYQEDNRSICLRQTELEDTPGTLFVGLTTTPWTLPANTAAAVHQDLDYVEVQVGADKLILAKTWFLAHLQDENTTL